MHVHAPSAHTLLSHSHVPSYGLLFVQLRVERGKEVFLDELLWDVNNPHNNPEQYAAVTCADLHLDPQWREAIAAQLRQQVAESLKVRCGS